MLQFRINEDLCVRCGLCAMDCPAMIIDLSAGTPRIASQKESHCLGCQHCLAICPAGALSILGYNPENSQPVEKMNASMVENLLHCRRSMRSFRSDALSADQIEKLLKAMACAPTAKNQRVNQVTLITDPKVMDCVRQQTMDGIQRAVTAGRLSQELKFFAQFARAFEKGHDIIYRGAPHMIVVSAPQERVLPNIDPYIALASFEVMAQAMGIGTLWCGFAWLALRSVVPELGLRLGIPEEHTFGYAMLFGFPARRYARSAQHHLEQIIHVTLEEME